MLGNSLHSEVRWRRWWRSPVRTSLHTVRIRAAGAEILAHAAPMTSVASKSPCLDSATCRSGVACLPLSSTPALPPSGRAGLRTNSCRDSRGGKYFQRSDCTVRAPLLYRLGTQGSETCGDQPEITLRPGGPEGHPQGLMNGERGSPSCFLDLFVWKGMGFAMWGISIQGQGGVRRGMFPKSLRTKSRLGHGDFHAGLVVSGGICR